MRNMVKDLKKLRLERGLSQMDMCRLVGVSIPTFRVWESGAGYPNPENLKKLAEVINKVPVAPKKEEW